MKESWYRFQFNARVRKNMYQSFADYLGQGIPVNDIVTMLAHSIVKAKAKSQMFQVKILDDLAQQMSTGVDFSDALAKWAPLPEVMSIRAGMKSGDPVTGMRNTIDALDASSSMMSTIVGKLMYPAMLLIALCALIFFFSVAILPKIGSVLDPASWPPPAKKLNTMSTFVREDWYVVISVVVGLAILVKWSLPRVVGPIRVILDKIPPYSFYKAFHSANILISLASLMRSGIPYVNALEELAKLSTPYLRNHLNKIVFNMSDGRDIGEAMDTGLFSTEMMVSIHMMSQNADFQAAINEIGRAAVQRSIDKISTIAGLLNAVALLGVTGYVGWVYYALFTVTNAMGQQIS
jgi:type II secretory pathway component PulF